MKFCYVLFYIWSLYCSETRKVFYYKLSALECASRFALLAKNFLFDIISGLSGRQSSRGSKFLPLGDSLYLASIY